MKKARMYTDLRANTCLRCLPPAVCRLATAFRQQGNNRERKKSLMYTHERANTCLRCLPPLFCRSATAVEEDYLHTRTNTLLHASCSFQIPPRLQISNSIWAAGHMQVRLPTSQLQKLMEAFLALNPHSMKAQEISSTLWGVAAMGQQLPRRQVEQLMQVGKGREGRKGGRGRVW